VVFWGARCAAWPIAKPLPKKKRFPGASNTQVNIKFQKKTKKKTRSLFQNNFNMLGVAEAERHLINGMSQQGRSARRPRPNFCLGDYLA
jgi:hypothetical protein